MKIPCLSMREVKFAKPESVRRWAVWVHSFRSQGLTSKLLGATYLLFMENNFYLMDLRGVTCIYIYIHISIHDELSPVKQKSSWWTHIKCNPYANCGHLWTSNVSKLQCFRTFASWWKPDSVHQCSFLGVPDERIASFCSRVSQGPV